MEPSHFSTETWPPDAHRAFLPIGLSDFDTLVQERFLWVDKSLFIKEFWQVGAYLPVILRPRRFGKSLNLNMLKSFFSIGAKPESFQGMKISQDEEMMKHCGKYPVIFLDFHACTYDNWDDMYLMIWFEICKMVLRHVHEIPEQIKFFESQNHIRFDSAIPPSSFILCEILLWLSETLYYAHNSKVIILIDEFETPASNAFFHGFIEEASSFFQVFYSSGLKGNRAVQKACMVGIVDAIGGGLLSGFNNARVFSMIDTIFSSSFGVTIEELRQPSFGFSPSEHGEILRWYNGYYSGDLKVMNPYSLSEYLLTREFDQYWVNTSRSMNLNNVLGSRFQEFVLNVCPLLFSDDPIPHSNYSTQIIYAEKNWTWDSIINFLIMSGYLTFKRVTQRTGFISIPNLEIHSSWEQDIQPLFNKLINDTASNIAQVFDQNTVDLVALQHFMESALLKISSFDCLSENSYHMFYFGIFLSLPNAEVTSNVESGHDICIDQSKDFKRVFIFDFKKSLIDTGLERDAQKGLEQAIKKRSCTISEPSECTYIAVSFFKKQMSSFHTISLKFT